MGRPSREAVVEGALGGAGRWQAGVVACLGATKLPVVWALLGVLFLAPRPRFRCPGAAPTPPHAAGPPSGVETNLTDPPLQPCLTECSHWEYDRDIFEETIVTEWNLVCGRRQLVNIGQVVFILGVMSGNIIISIISDRIGRKIPIVVTGVVMGVAGLGSALVTSYAWFVTLRVLQGIAVGGSIATTHVMCMEVLGSKYRPTVGNITHLLIYVGTGLSGLIAYFTRHWRYYQAAVSSPCLLFAAYWWLIPESPRWLLAVGRDKEGLEVLRQAAKTNNNPLPEDMPPLLKNQENEALKKYTPLDLVRTPNMRMKNLNIWFSFTVVSFCFYGIEQYLTEIGENMFLNVAVSGLVMVPGVLLSMYTMKRFGRRSTQFGSQLVSAVSCFLVAVLPSRMAVAQSILAILGVTGAAVTFCTVFLFGSELFPTVLRNSGIGLGATCSRVGAMVAPFVVSMDSFSPMVPPMLFAITSLLASGLTLFLPETLNRRLPVTLEDAENFRRNSKLSEVDENDNSTSC